MSSKAKTTSSSQSTSNTNSTAKTTPDVPDWLLTPAQQQAKAVGTLTDQGSSAFAPKTGALEQQAFATAAGLPAGGSSNFADAGSALGAIPGVSADQVTGQSLLDNLSSYYNPFKDQVLNPVLNDYDHQSGITRAAQAAQAAKGGAFQGSRYGIQEAQTEDALARGRSATEGGLLGQMYTSATGLSADDAARRQAAMTSNQSANLSASQSNAANALQKAGLLTSLGTAQGQDARSNLAAQSTLGATQTAEGNAAAQYPIQFQQQMEGLLQGIDPALFTGRTVTDSGTTNTTGKGSQTTSNQPGLLDIAKVAAMFIPP